ncbi:MAG: sugar transferase [Brumimicrobium sp.]|nr:sugar transferase [Brumimicrobium sp.]
MNSRLIKFAFIAGDILAAVLSWAIFFYFRKTYVENTEFTITPQFYLGIAIIPTFWFALYFVLGTYNDLRRMYFMKVLALSFKSILLGTLVIFFLIILDDEIQNYNSYYTLLGGAFFIHLIITLIPRLFLTKAIVSRIHKRKTGFRTLLIGGSKKAISIYKEINSLPKGTGNEFIGFVNLNGIDKELESEIPYLGHVKNLEEVLDEYGVEEVIIALDSTEHERLSQLITRIQGRDIKIKIMPDMFDLLSGSVKMTNIFGAVLIEVNEEIMPFWQFVVKRMMDILLSLIAVILLLPVYIVLAIMVKTSSKGPVFFLQERIGKHGRPFRIIKFRTMYVGAEKNGPQLSSSTDSRITKTGRFMRKVRLDETPQFWNVLVGEMSLVGPRPERKFFIDKIAEKDPQFLQLTKVKPGITSWGQVKYGYAENVNEMVQRMKFDLLYLKNMSIALDLKIMLYTIAIILKGSGK